MASSFPGGLDSFTNPSSGDNLSTSVGGRTHSAMHADVNDAVEAIEGALGVNLANVKDARVFDAVKYGAVVDGSTDDTAAWQAAINAAAAAGGGVVTSSKNGVSIIGGALQDTSGANAQLTLPSVHVTTGEQISIVLAGLTPPPAVASVIGTIPTPDNHLVLKSTLTTGSGGALLGGYGPSGSYQGFTCVDLTVRDVAFRMPSNPTHTALNLSNVVAVDLDRVVVDCGSYDVTGLTQPTTATSYGIRLPKNLNGAHTRLGQVDVVGFYTGILAPEHTFGQYVAAWGCVRAVEVPAGDHASRFTRLGVYHCTYGIKFTGGASALDVWQYNAEHGAATEAAWLQTTYDIDDPSNYGAGFVRWWSVLAGTGAHDVFTKNGGSGITTSRVGAALGAGGGGGSSDYVYRDRLVALAGNNVLTLGATPVANSPLVWVNGSIKWPGTDYTISGTTITFGTALSASDVVAVQYHSAASTASASALSGGGAIASDSFTRADSATTMGSTPTGSKAWTAIDGTWGIASNKAYMASAPSAGIGLVTVDAGVADCTLSAVVSTTSGNPSCGLVFRATDVNNWYVAEIQVGAAYTPKIYRRISGTLTTIATGASVTFAAGDTLSVVLSGSSITVKRNGTTIVSVTDSTYTTQTKHGLYDYYSPPGSPSPTRFDDFLVTA